MRPAKLPHPFLPEHRLLPDGCGSLLSGVPASAINTGFCLRLPCGYPKCQTHNEAWYSARFHQTGQFLLHHDLPSVTSFHSIVPVMHRLLRLDAVHGSEADQKKNTDIILMLYPYNPSNSLANCLLIRHVPVPSFGCPVV